MHVTSAGVILTHPKAKRQISGRPHRLFERTVIHCCRNLRLPCTVTPMRLPQTPRDLKGLEEGIFPTLCSGFTKADLPHSPALVMG